ncbi:MAG: 23S rRNA (cytosine1962-C5)-methyltransferase [Cryomorphaceae bacterium]|jgi:23S rRNA (cytosine1962-C5)-methyltransferase
MNYTILQLKDKSLNSIHRRHPWVFSGGIFTDTKNLQEGDKVQIADRFGKILGTGHFGARSIAVRLLSFGDVEINSAFYKEKLQNALDVRLSIGLPSTETDAFRLIHGEGDGLPGLIIDVYRKSAVIQTHSGGMSGDYELIKEAISGLAGIIIDETIHISAETKSQGTWNTDQSEGSEFLENGHRFYANWKEGQKTGFFIDQRENRALLGSLSKGKKVLNAFSYTGGFSVYALKAGAEMVNSLDSSRGALDLGEEHIRMNDLNESSHESIQAEALEFFSKEEVGEYDIIVLDPPAFAKHRSARHRAVQAYKRLNAMAMKKAKKGSLIFTFSCSQVVTPDLFAHTIAAAAMETGRNMRILRHLHQPPDHPVGIYHPEGEYLKGLLLRID